jgi:hypothetical protein
MYKKLLSRYSCYMNQVYIRRENNFCTLKPENNKQAIVAMVGVAAALLIVSVGTTHNSTNSALAQKEQQFVAKLSGSNEVPAVSTPASGTATFTLSADGKSLGYVIDVANINGVMGAHIHSGKTGQNGPIIAGLFNTGMVGPPSGKVNGQLIKGTITSPSLQGTMPGKQVSDLISIFKNQGAYVNIHTQQHQNGEIRGQIISGP